jgi:ParB/RepB/Spo0J family partition protein
VPKTVKAPPKAPVPTEPQPLALVEHNPSRQAHVDLQEVRTPKWANPREPVKPEQVEGLARTMERFGLLQPIVVMPDPAKDGTGYVLLAGHRRVAAARLLGWKTLPAHVLVPAKGTTDTIEHLLGAVAMVENGQREALDPLRDCEVVEAMLREPGATTETVAAELGRPKSFVARRARLSGLCERARALARGDGPIAGWPVAWLEDLALLPETEQIVVAELQAKDPIASASTLRTVVRQRLRTLGTAPWDLADENLGSNACNACPRHTGAQPDLFGTPRKAALSEAQCLDAPCWAGKADVWRSRAVGAAKARYGEDLVLVASPEPPRLETGQGRDYTADEVLYALEDQATEAAAPGSPRVFAQHDVVPSAKGAPGAQPALVVSGKDQGKTMWVRPGKVAANGEVQRPRATAAVDPAKPKTLAQKREALKHRRQVHVVLAFRERLEKWRQGELPAALEALTDDPATLLSLVSVWGTCPASEFLLEAGTKVRQGKEDGDVRLALLADRKKQNGRVLAGLLASWWVVLFRGCQIKTAQPYFSEVEAMCKATGQVAMVAMVGELAEEAMAACPEPKSWGGEPGPKAKAAARAKAPGVDKAMDKAPRKGKAKGATPVAAKKAKAKKGAPETACRRCGCTDSMACPGGCSWAEPDLCSTCKARETVPAKGRRKVVGKDAASGERGED